MNKTIKFLILDVDGTLTDGKLYIGNDGEVFKAFNIKDGCAINDILPKLGIVPVIITGRQSKIVENRAKELHITHLYQGIKDKMLMIQQILLENNISLSNVAYIGDDLNDLECMKAIINNGGVCGCPQNACKEIKELVTYVSDLSGGEGAVREFVEYLRTIV